MPSQRFAFLTLMMPSKENLYLLKTLERHKKREYMSIDDEASWLVALISDRGMRLSETASLHVDYIKEGCEIPHIDLKPNSWRGLKTRRIQRRRIPFVGASLWAAKRVNENNTSSTKIHIS